MNKIVTVFTIRKINSSMPISVAMGLAGDKPNGELSILVKSINPAIYKRVLEVEGIDSLIMVHTTGTYFRVADGAEFGTVFVDVMNLMSNVESEALPAAFIRMVSLKARIRLAKLAEALNKKTNGK